MFVLVPFVLLAATAGAADSAWPRCLSDACAAGELRTRGDWLTRDYVIDGKRLSVSIHEKALRWRCARGACAFRRAMPRFLTLQHPRAVQFVNCRIPPRQYSDLFQKLNINTNRLSISFDSNQPFDAFLINMALTELSIYSEKLVRLENNFVHLEDTLERLSLHKILMTDKQFNSIRSVKHLSLMKNGLEVIPDVSEFKHLERLVIRDPDLLDASALSLAPALQDLTLEAPDASLAAFPRLKDATFINVYIMERIFGNCSHLENLSVVCGSLSTLRAGWLAGCVRLRHLNLSHNALEALPETLLADAVKMTLLDLSYNNLNALPSDLLKHTEYLTHLDLSHNLLDAIPDHLLVYTKKLIHLDLSYNKLKTLSGDLLIHTNILKYSNFSHNQLKVLPGSFFDNAIAIARREPGSLSFDLSHNKLSGFPDYLLTNMRLFKNLNLNHNPAPAQFEHLLEYELFTDLANNKLDLYPQ